MIRYVRNGEENRLKEISLNTEIKIIEFTIDCKTETMNIELGNCMFREESPKVYRF